MTVAEAIRNAAKMLSSTSDTARLDAELLMAYALGVSRSDMLVRHMREDVPENFSALVERRSTHEPVAYINGSQEFYGRDFLVTSETLIPRSDSETLIEAALELCPQPHRVLDLGTGTGALLLTMLAETSASGVGLEQSNAAASVARQNAARLGLGDRAEISKGDWTKSGWANDLGQFDLILCNPPYVEDSAELEPDVREYEPSAALFAGPEGLDDYHILLPQTGGLMTANGVAIFEIGASQKDAVQEIARANGFSTQLSHDLAGRPRAVICTR